MIGVDFASIDGNAKPDFAAARAAGISFVYERASYVTWQDPIAARDRDAIRAAGIVYGAYMFPVMAINAPPPKDQVAAFKAGAGLVPGKDLPPVLDVEFSKGIAGTGRTRAQLVEWIRQARAELEDAFGITPMLYSSARVLDDSDTDCLAGLADNVVMDMPLWLARYTGVTALADVPRPRIAGAALWIHQGFGDRRGVAGFSSTVDVDEFYPLANGENSTRVQWAQKRLGKAVAPLTPGLNDVTTRVAVKAFQSERGLDNDGVVGVASFAALSWVQPQP